MTPKPDPARSAAQGRDDWRNVTSCMCSAKIDVKGSTIDKSACPIHGKAAKT